MLLFQYVDHLPVVPADLIEQILNTVHSSPVDHAVAARTVTVNDKIYNNIEYNRHRASDDLTNWIHTHIGSDYVSMGVQIQDPGLFNHTHFPHTDTAPRHWVLNYNIQPGGDHVITHWYQESDHPLVREGPTTPVDQNQLRVIESVQVQPFRWHVLNTSVLHGVENIHSCRIAITIGFAQNPLETLFNDS